jgi:hypothetical protein
MEANGSTWNMSSGLRPNTHETDGLEAAVDQAIATCDGDMR